MPGPASAINEGEMTPIRPGRNLCVETSRQPLQALYWFGLGTTAARATVLQLPASPRAASTDETERNDLSRHYDLRTVA